MSHRKLLVTLIHWICYWKRRKIIRRNFFNEIHCIMTSSIYSMQNSLTFQFISRLWSKLGHELNYDIFVCRWIFRWYCPTKCPIRDGMASANVEQELFGGIGEIPGRSAERRSPGWRRGFNRYSGQFIKISIELWDYENWVTRLSMNWIRFRLWAIVRFVFF